MSDPMYRLHDQLGTLGVALGRWADRDDTTAQPDVRQAANTAVDAIDAVLRALHQLRSCLAGEIRRSDNASEARVRALLAERRWQP